MMTRRLDYDVDTLDRDADAAFDVSVRAAQELGVLRGRNFYVVHDGTHHPFYGESHQYGKGARKVDPETLTVAGAAAGPAFRRQAGKRTGTPIYAGTKNMHDYFQLNLHVLDSEESLPLRVRRSGANPDALDDMIRAVDALPIKPLFWFADKEFATERYIRELLPWCNKNRVILLNPLPKTIKIRQKVVDKWHDGTARPVYANGEVMYWWAEPYRFNLNGRGVDNVTSLPFTLLTLYYEGEPNESDGVDDDVVSLGDEVHAVCFLVNVEVTQENVVWLRAQYGLRWATENVYKRAKAYLGTSFSSGMFGRHLAYVGGMLTLSAYALWRMERRTRLGLEVHDPSLSHVRFFEDLRRQCERRLLGQAERSSVLDAPQTPLAVGQKQRQSVLDLPVQGDGAVGSPA